MTHSTAQGDGHALRLALGGVLGVIAIYLVAVALGWPQAGTAMIVGGHAEATDAHLATDAAGPHAGEAQHHAVALHPADPANHAAEAHGAEHAVGHAKPTPPNAATVIPFCLLLGAIAVFPLVHRIEHWWESNLHRFYVAAGLGLLTLLYYLAVHPHPVDRHFLGHAVVSPVAGGLSFGVAWTILQNAIFNEYIPFIVLLFALYSICGGIRIEGDLQAHPLTNTAFIGVGALLASFIGTTGAAMLLIRPLLETNAERKRVAHTVVFFIFAVCNCGGCLLPIGDPPLFLGYLAGVDFLWTMGQLWPQWLFVNVALLVVYYVWDRFFAYPHEAKIDVLQDELRTRKMRFSGLAVNAPCLLGVILAVALLDPGKTFPGTDWHPWLYLREIVQLGLVALSLGLGSAAVRKANNFNFAAIIEVAALFVGIFVCMQPALQILDVRGATLGLSSSTHFFWATGSLSAVLDNAPTYLVFFKTAQALTGQAGEAAAAAAHAGVQIDLLRAVSLGAVFMGAMTYIGNGPNFMVKAIAEKSGVKMPSFFGYMAYSFGVLLPILVVMQWLLL